LYSTGEKGGLFATTFATLQSRNIEKLGEFTDVDSLNAQIKLSSNSSAIEVYAN